MSEISIKMENVHNIWILRLQKKTKNQKTYGPISNSEK